MQTAFDHRPTQMFAQKDRRSHEIKRISQLFLSLFDFQPCQPLARSAPCFAGFLSERTDKATSSGKSSENASSESSNYVRGKVLFWIKRDCGAGSSAKHERQGGRRPESKFTWFSAFRLPVSFEPPCFLCGLCASRESAAMDERAVKSRQLSVCVCG